MKYKIVKPIVLGFLTHNDSYEAILRIGTVHFNGEDIVYTSPLGNEAVSHTQNHALDFYLKDGSIEAL